jgi:nicotinamide-nucleotide amidase
MKAEIIMIGTELLLGQIVDTNAAYLARQLAENGFDLYHKTTVGDNDDRITESIRTALQRSDVVITSGGLGPTVDDKTRQSVAAATDRELYLDQELLAEVKAFFKRRGLELGENNPRQAYIPQDAIPVHNPVGTAPGFIVKYQGGYVISLPGVPHELKHLTENTVIPFLKKAFNITTVIRTRVLKTAGIGESNIDRMISDLEEVENPTVGLAAHLGSVDIRVSAKAESNAEADQLLEAMELKIRDRLENMVYGIDGETIEGVVVDLLHQSGLTLSVLETNTGGKLALQLTSAPKGYAVMSQAFCTSLEQVPALLSCNLEQSRLLSNDSAEKLAIRLREKTESDIGLVIVGDQDPDVGPYNQKTGHSFLGISTSDRTVSKSIQLGGISNFARIRISCIVLDKLRRFLL